MASLGQISCRNGPGLPSGVHIGHARLGCFPVIRSGRLRRNAGSDRCFGRLHLRCGHGHRLVRPDTRTGELVGGDPHDGDGDDRRDRSSNLPRVGFSTPSAEPRRSGTGTTPFARSSRTRGNWAMCGLKSRCSVVWPSSCWSFPGSCFRRSRDGTADVLAATGRPHFFQGHHAVAA